MDFLERQALFLGRILLISLIFGSCTKRPLEISDLKDDLEWLNAEDFIYKTEGGVTFSGKTPLHGIVVSITERGDTAFVHPYVYGKAEGLWIDRYENGVVKRKVYFNQGKKVGKSTAFWQDGMVKYKYNYLDDEFHGLQEEFNREGRLVRIMNYEKGHESGEQKVWYDNGKIKSNYVVKDGRRFGLLGTKNCVNVADSISLLD